jgi:hypothetical protein
MLLFVKKLNKRGAFYVIKKSYTELNEKKKGPTPKG